MSLLKFMNDPDVTPEDAVKVINALAAPGAGGQIAAGAAAAVVAATIPVSNITHNADGTVSGYTWGGVTYAVTYHPSGFGIQTITGGGKTTTVFYNAAGQIIGVTYA